MAKFYYTYVLENQVDKKLYIGWTNNLIHRLNEHNQGRVKSTKCRKPFKLIYYEACLSKRKAIDRENTLKTGFGRKFLKTRI